MAVDIDTPEGFLSEAQIRKFNEDGYVIVDFEFGDELIDELVSTLHPYYNPAHLQAPSFGARIQDAWKFVKPSHALATNRNVLRHSTFPSARSRPHTLTPSISTACHRDTWPEYGLHWKTLMNITAR